MKFKLFGVPVYFSYSSIGMLTLAVLASKDSSIIILVSLFSAVCHEAGHLYFISKFQGSVSAVNIYPFEVQIKASSQTCKFCEELVINLAGVTVNLCLAIIGKGLYMLSDVGLFEAVYICNVILLLFNLLPVRGLDGCNTLELVLQSFVNQALIQKTLNIISILITVPIMVAGLYLAVISVSNYTLLFIAIYLIVLIIYKEMR